MSEAGADKRKSLRRGAVLVFCLVLAGYHLNLRALPQVDTFAAPYVSWQLVHHGGVDLTDLMPLFERPTERGIILSKTGGWISRYPPGSAIMAAPFFGAMSVYRDTPPSSSRMQRMGKLAAATYCALAAVLVFLTVSRLFPGAEWPATVLFAFGTTVYSTAGQALWQHGPAVFWTALGLYVLLAAEGEITLRRAAGAGFALGAATVCRPPVAVFLLGLVAALLVSRRPRAAAGMLVGALGPVAALLAYNLHCTGHILWGGYGVEAQGREPHFWTGLAGLAVAPSRGILFFTPAVVLAAWGAALLAKGKGGVSAPRQAILAGAGAGAVLLPMVHAGWADWSGTWCYGPRYLTEAMPVVAVFFALAWREMRGRRARITAWGLVGISAAIHVVGVFARDSAWHERHYLDPGCTDLFRWGDNQILSSAETLWRRALDLLGR